MKKSLNLQIFKTKHIFIYLVLIIILAAGLRTIRAFEQNRYDPDAYLYFKMAENITDVGFENAYFPSPFMPFLLPYFESCGSYIGLSPETTGLLLGGVLGSLMPLAAFVIIMSIVGRKRSKTGDQRLETEDQRPETREWGPETIDQRLETTEINEQRSTNNEQPSTINKQFLALLGAFLIAVHPFLIRISVSCMRECLYIPILFFAVMFAIIAINKKSVLLWAIVAILSSLGTMTRTEGIEILIIFLIWCVCNITYSLFSKQNSRFEYYYIKTFVLYMVIFLAVIIPVEIYLLNTNCNWSITLAAERGMRLFKWN